MPLLSPLPADISPVATFGELAPGSFHPGIDLPAGREPYEVHAAAEGAITRVRLSASGYGRALDLTLPDGRTIVYAHLSSFMPAIEDSCRARQLRSSSSDLDWSPPADAFPVIRGAVIARTGETEDGRAILHIEVRVDGSLRNPLCAGFSWPDRAPPRIHAIRFVPLDASARVDGRLDTEVVDADRDHGSLTDSKTVVWGPLGIDCEASDDVGGQKRAPYQVCLEIDGVPHYDADIGTRVPTEGSIPDLPEPRDPQQAPLQRLYRPSDHDRGRLLCGSGIPPGLHRIRLIARDAAGNLDSVSTVLLVQANPRVEEWMTRPLGHGAWDVSVHVGPSAAGDPEQIRLSIDLTDDGRHFPVHSVLGHLGSGWFLGQASSFTPAGKVGLRVRLETREGITTCGPIVSLEADGTCMGAAVDSPTVKAFPRWLELRDRIACIPAAAPKATLQLPGATSSCDLLDTDPGKELEGSWQFVASPPRRGRSGAAVIWALTVDGETRRWRLPGIVLALPSEDLLWTTPDGALTVEIPAATFYAPVWLSWKRTDRDEDRIPHGEIPVSPGSPDQDEVLIARSDVHAIAPAGVELDAPFRISLRPRRLPTSGEEARRLGIYGRSGASPWQPRGGLWTGSAVVAVVDRLEEWIVLEDRSEPWLYALDPGPGDRRTGRIRSLSAQVREQGSGVSSGSFEVILDGKRVPAAWNPWSRTLTVTLSDSLSAGGHRWEVLARDAAGNAARRAATFTMTPQH